MKIKGTVVAGSRIGRTLGYPTANIPVEDSLDLQNGVYAAWVWYDGRRYGAMANLGVKPTFPGSGRVLELHLLDFEGDLYGAELEVELTGFIRPERRFASPEELRAQIAHDKFRIEEILNSGTLHKEERIVPME